MADLTEQELRVVELAAAECLANDAIADRLDLSPRTVEVHLASAARRLGCPSERKQINPRAWLVRWWHQRPDLSERDLALADVGRAALRASKAGVHVALDHETGQWTIHDKSSAGGNIEPMPDPYEFFSAGGASTREGENAVLDASTPSADRGAGAANTGAPPGFPATRAGGAGPHAPGAPTSWRAFASTFDLSGETIAGEPLIDVDAAVPDKPDPLPFWNLINQHADELTGTDFNVVRAWLDCTIRPALFGDREDVYLTDDEVRQRYPTEEQGK